MKIDTEEQLLEESRHSARGYPRQAIPVIMMGQHGKAHRVMAPVRARMVLCVQRYTPVGIRLSSGRFGQFIRIWIINLPDRRRR